MPTDATFYRSLASLHRAGLSWSEALASVDDDGRLIRARGAVAGGTPLHEALAGEVGELERALLAAGEQAGSLETVLEDIANDMEDRRRAQSQMRSALTYPVLLAHIGAVLLALPDVIQGEPLAGLNWTLLILAPVYLLIWLGRSRQEEDVPPRLPGLRFGPFLTRVEEADARAMLALAACHDAGVPLDRAVELAASAGRGGRAAVDLHAMPEVVRRGEALGTYWRHLPSPWSGALAVGEQTGELSRAAKEAASALRFSADQRRKRLRAVLPVVMMLVIGGIIAARLFSYYARMLPGR